MSDRLYRRVAIGLGILFGAVALMAILGTDIGVPGAIAAVVMFGLLWAVVMMGLAGL